MILSVLLGVATLGAGLEARDGQGTVGAEPFVYPNTGIVYESDQLYVEGNSPLPVALPDGIAALVLFLARGDDEIPLWYGLNGNREPVAFRFADGSARWAIPFADVAALELGATAGFTIGSVYAGDERIGVHPFRVGPSIAFRTGSTDTVVVRFAIEGGNAWTHHASANPWIGASLRSTMSFGEKLVFELRGDWRRMQLDLSRYRTVEGDPVAGHEVVHIYGAEVRVGFRL